MNASNLTIVFVFGLMLALIIVAFTGIGGDNWTSAQAAAAIAGISLAGGLGYFRFLYTWEFRPAVNLTMDLQIVHNDEDRLAVLARIAIQNPTRVGAEVPPRESEFSTRAAMLNDLPVGTDDAHTFFRPRARHLRFLPLDEKPGLPVIQGAKYDPLRSETTGADPSGSADSGPNSGAIPHAGTASNNVDRFHLVPQGTHNLIAWGIFPRGSGSGLRSSGAVVVEAAFRVKLSEPKKWRQLLIGAPVNPASDVFAMCIANGPTSSKQLPDRPRPPLSDD